MQKVKIVSLSWNLVPRLIRICRIQWCCSLSLVWTQNTLFRQLCSKKSKFVSLSWNLVPWLIRICRIQWWCFFLSFGWKYPFLSKFDPKNQNCWYKLKFGTYGDVHFFSFQLEVPFLSKFGPKNQSLSWNLVPRLFPRSRIHCWCSLFLFKTGNAVFRQIWSKT